MCKCAELHNQSDPCHGLERWWASQSSPRIAEGQDWEVGQGTKETLQARPQATRVVAREGGIYTSHGGLTPVFGLASHQWVPPWNDDTVNICILKPVLVFTALLWLAQLFNKICRIFITPNAMSFSKEICMVIKYSKMKYRRGFIKPARNGVEVHITPNEFISIKIPSLPTT